MAATTPYSSAARVETPAQTYDLVRSTLVAAVAGIVGVESFGIPAPGQIVLITAAVYAGAGRLNIAAVAAIGVLATVIGDNIRYLIGRTGGRRLILRNGVIAGHHRHELETVSHLQRRRRRLLGRTLTTLGYLAGTHIVTVYNTISHYQWYALAAVLTGYISLRHIRHRPGNPAD